jgi:hypothetical protein
MPDTQENQIDYPQQSTVVKPLIYKINKGSLKEMNIPPLTCSSTIMILFLKH